MSRHTAELRAHYGGEQGFELFSAVPKESVGGEIKLPPSEIQIFREGQFCRLLGASKDGKPVFHRFQLTPAHFEQIVANKAKEGDDLPIDVEHCSVEPDDKTPAQGWIKELRVGPDPRDATKKALFGAVDWTGDGADNVRAKRWRYVSGGVFPIAFSREDGAPIGHRLDHVALVKKPFITGMQPLTNSSHFPGSGRADGRELTMKLLPKLILLFGAAADTDETAILAKIEEKEGVLKDVIANGAGLRLSAPALEVLTLKAGSSSTEVSDAILKLAARATQVDIFEKRLGALETERVASEVNALIAAFKIQPSQKDDFLKLAKLDYDLFKSTASKLQASPPAEKLRTAGLVRAGSEEDDKKRNAMISERMKANPGESYTQAMLACAQEKPELFKQDYTQPAAPAEGGV